MVWGFGVLETDLHVVQREPDVDRHVIRWGRGPVLRDHVRELCLLAVAQRDRGRVRLVR